MYTISTLLGKPLFQRKNSIQTVGFPDVTLAQRLTVLQNGLSREIVKNLKLLGCPYLGGLPQGTPGSSFGKRSRAPESKVKPERIGKRSNGSKRKMQQTSAGFCHETPPFTRLLALSRLTERIRSRVSIFGEVRATGYIYMDANSFIRAGCVNIFP